MKLVVWRVALLWGVLVAACGEDSGSDGDGGGHAGATSSGGADGSGGASGGATGSGGDATGGTPGSGGGPRVATTADHAAVVAYDAIPASVLAEATALRLYYGHTSHGSQLVTGVDELGESLFSLHETSLDLGSADWNVQTDDYLAGHPEVEVVAWSWCSQQSSNSVEVVQTYLDEMSALEAKYPDVQFIYMTGHLRGAYDEYLYGDAENAVLQRNNAMVRDHAEANGRWLFDFADIESYLDDSTEQCMYGEFPNECVWPTDETGCAHSRMPNCVRKGKAFLTLLARMTGWSG